MHSNSQIESFISSLNFSWQDLIEILPVGIVFFDENWKIKSINRNFTEFFAFTKHENMEGVNLFSMNILSDKLPFKEISQLKHGKFFEKIVTVVKIGSDDQRLLIKGAPIFKEGSFQGGILIVEDYNLSDTLSSELLTKPSSIVNFLRKICSCFLVFDLEANLQFISADPESKCEIFEDNVNNKLSTIFTLDSDLDISEIFQRTIEENKVQYAELIYYSDREKINYKAVFVPFSDGSNQVQSVVILLRDINEPFNDTISYLSNSSTLKEYESFATIGMDGLFKINLHGKIIYWTQKAEELFSIAEQDIISKFIGDLFPEITYVKFESIRDKILDSKYWEGFLTSKNSLQENLLKVKIISKVENGVTDLFVYCNKIDKQQQQLLSAREEEKLFFRDAVIKSNQMILQTNPNGTILFANEKFCEKFNYELDEIRGIPFSDLINDNFKLTKNISDFEQFINNTELEIISLDSKSSEIIEVCYNVNISTYNSELKYFTIYFRECSSRDRLFLETAHALLYRFPDPVCILKEDTIVKVNPQFCKIFESKFETEFFDMSVNQIIAESSRQKFSELLNTYSIENETTEIAFLRKNNTKFTADVTKICCSKDSKSSIFILKNTKPDIEDEQNEDEIIKKQLGKIGPYYWKGTFINNEINIEYIDKIFVDLTGYSQDRFINQPNFLKDIIHPDDINKIFDHFENIDKGTEDEIKEVTFRIINTDGEIVWIKNRFKLKVTSDEEVEIFGSISNVTDWTLEREELRSIITELDRLNTAKEKFISIISHDLKSPFTSIVGFSELILTDTTLEKDEILDYVSHIKDASLHTVDLLNGLLDLTKLQTGRIEVEPKIINANYIARKSVEILSGLAYQKGLTLSSNVDKNFYITADDNLIFQVFNNLVANSIKFTPKGGSIDILAREIPALKQIEFTIKDSGVGIEKEDLSKLFVLDKKFTTLGTDGERGTGLGLSLVKEIIDKHGGKIDVKSEVNEGTEFIFTLPISSPSILIIDKNQAERVVYSKLLQSITENIEIIQAVDEEEGIKLVKEKMPMLIIFEHQLLNINGDEFIGELKKAGLIYEPSLMILTKEFNEELKNSYLDIGVNAVFSKPFELKKFKAQLDKLIGKIE